MPSILHRGSGTENQVLNVTLARLQACDSMRPCSSVVAIVAATREAIFHGHRTSFVRPNADGKQTNGEAEDDYEDDDEVEYDHNDDDNEIDDDNDAC